MLRKWLKVVASLKCCGDQEKILKILLNRVKQQTFERQATQRQNVILTPLMSPCKRQSLWALFGLLALALSCPAQSVFNVMNYGATGNGTATGQNSGYQRGHLGSGGGGGRHSDFPAGELFLRFHPSLTNNITLYLSNNVVILASKTNIDLPEMNVYSNYQDYGHSYFHDALVWGEEFDEHHVCGNRRDQWQRQHDHGNHHERQR